MCSSRAPNVLTIMFVRPGVNSLCLFRGQKVRPSQGMSSQQNAGCLYSHGGDVLDIRRGFTQGDKAVVLHQDHFGRLPPDLTIFDDRLADRSRQRRSGIRVEDVGRGWAPINDLVWEKAARDRLSGSLR